MKAVNPFKIDELTFYLYHTNLNDQGFHYICEGL